MRCALLAVVFALPLLTSQLACLTIHVQKSADAEPAKTAKPAQPATAELK